jgi:diguanylate cyclase
MKGQRKIIFGLIFILLYILIYYIWIIGWKNDQGMFPWGGSILSIFGCLIAATWLARASKSSNKTERPFWFLLSLGCQSYFLAELIRLYYEIILEIQIPFPGYADFFYMLEILFFLSAFFYKITKEKRKYQVVKFLFDVSIVMTVASTFSWHFIIGPIVSLPVVSNFSLIVSYGYPLGDLALLFGAISIYFGTRNTFSNKVILSIFLGLLTQIFADSSYLYLISIGKFSSGSFIDPLFIAGILFVGFAGVLHKEGLEEKKIDTVEELPAHKLDFLRLFLPYLNVTVLFIFMIFTSNGIDAITIGTGISILLVMIRQVLIILENQQLLHKYYKKAEEVTYLAYHDPLTGLSNRAFFEEMLQQSIADAKRNSELFAIMFIDLDRFKTINDSLGHYVGDQLLVSVSERLKKSVRANDLVARQGGDEFTLLIKGISSSEDAIHVAQKILDSLNLPHILNGHEIISTPSIGIAIYPLDDESPVALMKKADIAMYQVKENGKGHYRLYNGANEDFSKELV